MTFNIPLVNTCRTPDITNGIVSPVSDTVDFGSNYTISCDNGYTASSTDAMNCTAVGTLDVEQTCDSKPVNYLSLFLLKILTFVQSTLTFGVWRLNCKFLGEIINIKYPIS